MTDLPAGWRMLTPHEIAGESRQALIIGPFGSNLKKVDYRPEGIPLVFVRDIRSGDFSNPRTFVSPDKAEELKAHQAFPGDVLITKMGTPPGDTAVYNGSGPAVITADCIRLRPAFGFDTSYIAYAMLSPDVRAQILAITSGVAHQKVSLDRFRHRVRLPVPPLPEQKRIVAVLEDYLSRLDAGVDYLTSAAQRLSVIGDAMFASAGELVGLEPVRLDSLIAEKLSNGRSVPTADSGFPVLRLTAMKNGRIDLKECKIGRWTAEEASPFLVARNDVLVARGNGSLRLVGRAAMVVDEPDAVAFPDTMIRIRPDCTKMLPEYLSLAWNSRVVRRQIESIARTTAGIYKVSQKDLQKILVPTPDLPAQQAILQRMGEHNAAVQRLSRQVEWARARAGSLRRAVFAATLSGRLTGAPDAEQAEEIAVGIVEAEAPEGVLV
ncbi:restriction endonuclease subunit S [Streptomyces poriferorum]|uniref:Restriction endonuclease subunit S n=1 Tax=Streptomyces poriferorum TaxID=2798799 RepID=A0ABY9J2R8_9ACTN|nr:MULTISPECIES: restriction endonuclease subunit S [unclassified Streptomyces]MDP5317341.1 restriction endonuclease subunit S [Streptomyces sp. Alt4]WLQ62031.1 restriction endonuclease subunit S [Streptomyces sp. Alt2]